MTEEGEVEMLLLDAVEKEQGREEEMSLRWNTERSSSGGGRTERKNRGEERCEAATGEKRHALKAAATSYLDSGMEELDSGTKELVSAMKELDSAMEELDSAVARHRRPLRHSRPPPPHLTRRRPPDLGAERSCGGGGLGGGAELLDGADLGRGERVSIFRSIAMAAEKADLPDMKMMALFGFGSVILRGVACTVNDLLDRDIDKKVERTKSRPLASGALTPAQGFYFLVFQVLLWLGFLLQLNNQSLIAGSSWLVLFISYPLMKRLTHWPQAFLGFTISCGIFLGSTAIKGSLDYAVLLPMYFAGICWTLVYDTIYAHQDKKDDFKAGVKSTAIKFGDNTKYWLSGFGAACISSLALTGYNAHLAWQYYPFLAAAAGHLAWQVSTVDLSDKSDCNSKFVSNKWFGALIFGGILFGVLAS